MKNDDSDAWLGADENKLEWAVRTRFSNGSTAVTDLTEFRDHAESRAERAIGFEDPDAPDGAVVTVVWRRVGPWCVGDHSMVGPMEKIGASLEDQYDQVRDRDAQCRDYKAMTQAEGDRRFLLRVAESHEREIKDLNRRIEWLKRSLGVARGEK